MAVWEKLRDGRGWFGRGWFVRSRVNGVILTAHVDTPERSDEEGTLLDVWVGVSLKSGRKTIQWFWGRSFVAGDFSVGCDPDTFRDGFRDEKVWLRLHDERGVPVLRSEVEAAIRRLTGGLSKEHWDQFFSLCAEGAEFLTRVKFPRRRVRELLKVC